MTQSEQFDAELFILEIEERPALWNSSLKEYSDKNVRKAMWEEIVQKFGGEELDVEEKKELGVQLQKKWKNIRDCYFREIRQLKKVCSGAAAPKKSTYIYFDQLQFLKVVTESGPIASNTECAILPGAAEISETQLSQGYIPPQKKKRNDDVIEMVNALKSNIKSREESKRHDCDKFFLLSLLDDFKKIPDYLKNSAKIEMLNVVQKYQPLLGSSAHHLQHETYPYSQRAAYANSAKPSSLHHQQRSYYSSSHPDRPSSGHSYHSYDHSTTSPESVSQDSDCQELFN